MIDCNLQLPSVTRCFKPQPFRLNRNPANVFTNRKGCPVQAPLNKCHSAPPLFLVDSIPAKPQAACSRVSISRLYLQNSHARGIGNTQQIDVCVRPLFSSSLVDIIIVSAVLLSAKHTRKITEDPGWPPSPAMYALSQSVSQSVGVSLLISAVINKPGTSVSVGK